jgi:hypothetical protein
VRGRLFVQLDDHHHGADHLAVWLPAPLGEQEAMVFADPERFFRPPYVGPRGWVGVRIDRRPDWTDDDRYIASRDRTEAAPRRSWPASADRLRRCPFRRQTPDARHSEFMNPSRVTPDRIRHEATKEASDL